MAKVFLSTCLHRNISSATATSLTEALINLRGHHEITWGQAFDALITRARSVQAQKFLDDPTLGDVFVFIDDDIRFSTADLDLLVRSCEYTESIACGMYVTRDTIRATPALALFPGQSVTIGPSGGRVEIKYGATGFMAIHRRVVETLAEMLPMVYSGPRFFHPFFHDILVETPIGTEMLSEDYAFCHIAREAGFKVWLEEKIALGHIGEYAFEVQRLHQDAFSQVITMDVEQGGPDSTNIISDLAAYKEIDRRDVEAWIRRTELRTPVTNEWNSHSPETPEEVAQFYQDTETYLPELVKFNISDTYLARTKYVLSITGDVVEFGGGIGTLALRLHQRSCNVTYVDLPSPHRDFAEFRFKRHGADIAVATSLAELEDNSAGTLVGTDVFEHIHPDALPDIVEEIVRVLRPEGHLYAINHFHREENLPEHYESTQLWADLMEKHGFTNVHEVLWEMPQEAPIALVSAND